MENNIDLISINALLNEHFFIPSYQRGYRWNIQQVEDLLNDINEFDSAKDGRFYCLQPLVVKQNNNQSWNVIDGQQRLTTIYLILNHVNEYFGTNCTTVSVSTVPLFRFQLYHIIWV